MLLCSAHKQKATLFVARLKSQNDGVHTVGAHIIDAV